MNKKKFKNILVVLGGSSGERAVSLESGKACIEALKKLGSRVKSVHCKDATWADQPGEAWGQEVPLGQGDVGIQTYLETLREIGYDGPLTIEREIPQDPERQKSEIGGAIETLNRTKQAMAEE